MPTFPWINLFFMCFSTWVALDKRFRSKDAARNWWIYRLNLGAAAINAVGILVWLFNWVSA